MNKAKGTAGTEPAHGGFADRSARCSESARLLAHCANRDGLRHRRLRDASQTARRSRAQAVEVAAASHENWARRGHTWGTPGYETGGPGGHSHLSKSLQNSVAMFPVLPAFAQSNWPPEPKVARSNAVASAERATALTDGPRDERVSQ